MIIHAVRRMSALPARFAVIFGANCAVKSPKIGAYQHDRISPKAKVRGSNPLGRANYFNGLGQ
jgi:hypothetical protein